MVVQINKIDLNLTSNLTLTLTRNDHRKKCEKQVKIIIVSLLKYIILLKSGYPILDQCRFVSNSSIQFSSVNDCPCRLRSPADTDVRLAQVEALEAIMITSFSDER